MLGERDSSHMAGPDPELSFAGLRSEGKAGMSPNHTREQIIDSLKQSCVVAWDTETL